MKTILLVTLLSLFAIANAAPLEDAGCSQAKNEEECGKITGCAALYG